VSLSSGNYYLSSAYTYYVYYPYDSSLNLTYPNTSVAIVAGSVLDSDVTGVQGFPSASAFFSNCINATGPTHFEPANSQTTLDSFKASDYQVGRAGYADGTFTAAMNHQMSLARLVLQSVDIPETITYDGRTNVPAVSSAVYTATPGNTFNSSQTGSVLPYRKPATDGYYCIVRWGTTAKKFVDGNTGVNVKWETSPINIVKNDGTSLGKGNFKEFTVISHLASRGWLHYIVNYPYNVNKVSMSFHPPVDGVYKFECWGAQGGGHVSPYTYGKGGYTSGNLSVTTTQTFYVYVGEFGGHTFRISDEREATRAWNGGGAGYHINFSDYTNYAGGGATDIRLTAGNWDDGAGLNSRIMVAAGGGGVCHGGFGGYGGGLTGGKGVTYQDVNHPDYLNHIYAGVECPGLGGTQSGGGAAGAHAWPSPSNSTFPPSPGVFGKGGDGNKHYGGGGGGGYYGGGGSGTSYLSMGGGGGGSSYISGYSGCANHSSGLRFTSTVMHAGDSTTQPQPDGTTATGHAGDGYARITFVSE
jgi:hypothetical protein